MRFNQLILQITETCPLQCAHCCVESGPWQTTSMALDDARSYVRQAQAMNPETLISFTGGEPFLHFRLMRDIAVTAHELGLAQSVVTSGVWCKSRAFARKRFAELQHLGLRIVTVSYDAFHQPWVSRERVQDCITAAADLGLAVYVNGVVTCDSPGACDLLGDWPAQFPNVTVSDGPMDPNGRGRLIPLDDLLLTDWRDVSVLCPMSNQVLIRADGTAYPCCPTGGDYDYLALGNARETPLAELRARAENALWFRIIATGGFRVLEGVVQRY